MRRALAFLVAPLAVAGPMVLAGVAWWLLQVPAWRNHPDLAGAAIGYLVAGIAVSYVCTWMVGMPAHYVLQRLGRTTLQDYVLTGVGLTVIPVGLYFVLVVIADARGENVFGSLRQAAMVAAMALMFVGSCGAAVAGLYWELNVGPRPGRKAPV
jgi:hypothetical protein